MLCQQVLSAFSWRAAAGVSMWVAPSSCTQHLSPSRCLPLDWVLAPALPSRVYRGCQASPAVPPAIMMQHSWVTQHSHCWQSGCQAAVLLLLLYGRLNWRRPRALIARSRCSSSPRRCSTTSATQLASLCTDLQPLQQCCRTSWPHCCAVWAWVILTFRQFALQIVRAHQEVHHSSSR
jgi:hypothetical protein